MDYDDIRLFVKVAEFKSFVKAATELRIQTSLLSRRIARLEATLGVRLLQRTTRTVSLTEEGEKFLHDTQLGLDYLKSAVETLNSVHGAPKGKVRVTSPIDIGQYLIDNLMPGFLKKYPDIQIEWDVVSFGKGVVERGLDLSIRSYTFRQPPEQTLIEKNIGNLTLYPYQSPRIETGLTRENAIAHIENVPWIVFNVGPLELQPAKMYGTFAGVERELHPRNIRFRVNSLLSIRDMIIRGLGIGYLPPTIADEAVAKGQLIQVLPGYMEGPTATFYAGYPSREYLAPKVRVLIDYLVDEFPFHARKYARNPA